MNVTNIMSINHTAHPERQDGGGGEGREGWQRDKESERHTEKKRERGRRNRDQHSHHHGNRLAKCCPVLPGCSAPLIWYNLPSNDEITSKSLNLQLREFRFHWDNIGVLTITVRGSNSDTSGSSNGRPSAVASVAVKVFTVAKWLKASALIILV